MNVYVLMFTTDYEDTFAVNVYESKDEAIAVCNDLNERVSPSKKPGTGYSVQECEFFKTLPPTPVASA